MMSRFAVTSVSVVFWIAILSVVACTASGCGSSQPPAAPGVETHAALKPTGPLEAVHVSLATSDALSSFRGALAESVTKALASRDLDAEVNIVAWSPPSDTAARPVQDAVAKANSRVRRGEQPMLLVVRELSHGLRAQQASASGWGGDAPTTEHVIVLSARLVDLQTQDVAWSAEVITRTARLASSAMRAEESAHQLTSALVRDEWIRPLLPASARR